MARSTATDKPKVTLADLDDAARAELLAELAAEAAKRNREVAGIEVDGAERELSAREVAIRALLRDRDHLDGCPVYGSTLGRVEAYEQVKPANPARAEPASTMTIARCIECGGSRVRPGSVPEVLTEVLGAAGASAAELDGSI